MKFFDRPIAWLLIIAFGLLVALAPYMQIEDDELLEMPYSELAERVRRGDVQEVVVQKHRIHGVLHNGTRFMSVRPMLHDPDLLDDMYNHGVEIKGHLSAQPSLWSELMGILFHTMLFIGVMLMLYRLMTRKGRMGMGGGITSLLSGDVKVGTAESVNVTFDDVAGVDEAKEELVEIVEFLRDPQKFINLGGRIPRGVLLSGAPGTGKTLLAKAIAGEASTPFFSLSGSNFVEMFVGVGASRVRNLFRNAHKAAPCIVFIDEIDAVGRHRGAGLGGGHDEREQTLNQLLVEMDGFESDARVIVIASTNRPDVLDPALLRPGRFDRQVVVHLPDVRGREQILNVHMRDVRVGDDVDASIVARGTPGFTGADLANLVNESALTAARRGAESVKDADFESAKDKIIVGAERRNRMLNKDVLRLTAYHEAGHVLAGSLSEGHDPVYKATIIPRGMTMGATFHLPESDRTSLSKLAIKSKLCGLMGGRAAEEIVFGPQAVTTGAASDIKEATHLAHNFVMRWGLSDRMGAVTYDTSPESPFLGKQAAQPPHHLSASTLQAVDEEKLALVRECYERAKALLRGNLACLHRLAESLLELETLSPEQIKDILQEAGIRPA